MGSCQRALVTSVPAELQMIQRSPYRCDNDMGEMSHVSNSNVTANEGKQKYAQNRLHSTFKNEQGFVNAIAVLLFSDLLVCLFT